MIKLDELELVAKCFENGGRLPSDVMDGLTKRQYGILEKWLRKGYWDFGVSLRTGWFTHAGEKHFMEFAQTELKRIAPISS